VTVRAVLLDLASCTRVHALALVAAALQAPADFFHLATETKEVVEKNALLLFYERRDGGGADGDGVGGSDAAGAPSDGDASMSSIVPSDVAVIAPGLPHHTDVVSTAEVLAMTERSILAANEYVALQARRFDEQLFQCVADLCTDVV
jgi:hypothetical protein